MANPANFHDTEVVRVCNEDRTLADDELMCAICQEPFCQPVTLSCGHTFDLGCLHQLAGIPLDSADDSCLLVCPLDRRPVVGPLPCVNRSLQTLARLRFQHAVECREAQFRSKLRDSEYHDIPERLPPDTQASPFRADPERLDLSRSGSWARHTVSALTAAIAGAVACLWAYTW
mmetsp:Transcript_67511/g.162028  ORF Transcript_67511/g.162028 Transcript_67511/m.162028 type:complete len:174 (+) Transcript_67511:89-610(+)